MAREHPRLLLEEKPYVVRSKLIDKLQFDFPKLPLRKDVTYEADHHSPWRP